MTARTRARFLTAALLLLVFGSPAMSETSPDLDPVGVRGVRMMLRDDAVMAATGTGDTALDWARVGIERPAEIITTAQVRAAFEANVVDAERRFARPFVVRGPLHSVVRGRDRQVVARFADGGAADGQRRAFRGLEGPDPNDVIGGLTAGLMHAGAHAALPNGHEDLVAAWRPGQQVALLCRGAANTRLALLLRACIPVEAAAKAAEEVADRQAELLLTRRALEVVPAQTLRSGSRDGSETFLLLGYTIGLISRDCRQEATGPWRSCMDVAWRRLPRRERDAAIQKAAQELGLTPPPATQAPAQAPARNGGRQRP